jgi:predicted MFS family arabinose efflux permease
MSNFRQRLAAQIVGPSFVEQGMPPAIVALFALACGVTIANIYYAQSLAGPISLSLGIPASYAGVIVTATQLGFGAGLFFVVSLADLVENRRLIVITSAGLILSLVGVIASPSAPLFFLSSFTLGVCAVGAQILLPLSAHLSPEKVRGQVIGNIMGGLLAGIMLSRPLASILTAHFGWRAVFVVSAAVMLLILALLLRILPRREPRPGISYRELIASMGRLAVSSRPLQRRAAYQGTLFAVFNLFWTGAPLMLHDRFGYGQDRIALFALAAAGGALIAPVAGRLADWGQTRITTGCAIASVALTMLATGWAVAGGAILTLTAITVVFDAAIQTNHIVSQRVVYSISAEARGRLNGVYMTSIFLCGAVGSALGSLTYFGGGWWLTTLVGVALTLAVMALYLTEFRRPA